MPSAEGKGAKFVQLVLFTKKSVLDAFFFPLTDVGKHVLSWCCSVTQLQSKGSASIALGCSRLRGCIVYKPGA